MVNDYVYRNSDRMGKAAGTAASNKPATAFDSNRDKTTKTIALVLEQRVIRCRQTLPPSTNQIRRLNCPKVAAMEFLKTYQEFATKQNAFVIKVERDRNVEARKFANSKYLNFYIRIYIDVENSSARNIYTLDDVSFVKYELHPSYKEPVRVASDRQNNFELKVWTYGFYPIKATVYLKYGGSVNVRGNVEFPDSPKEKETNQGEV